MHTPIHTHSPAGEENNALFHFSCTRIFLDRSLKKTNLKAFLSYDAVWLQGHVGDEEAEIGLHPSNSQKADEWPQESLKTTKILLSSPERRSKKPRVRAVGAEEEKICPGLDKQGWVFGSWDPPGNSSSSCNSAASLCFLS